jgi:hypothetical protein
VLLPQHRPQLTFLPLFLTQLATEVDYSQELPCFQGVIHALASFYAQLPLDLDPTIDNKSAGARLKLSAEGLEQLRHLLLPAMKKYLKVQAPNGAQEVTFLPLTSLEQLYKVFERC